MNKSRRLLTLIALVSFVVILFVIGSNQSPYDAMQIEWGRARVWGLTPLGNSLSILIVFYIGLFATLNDDRFLIRCRQFLARFFASPIVRGFIIAFSITIIVAGAGILTIMHEERAEKGSRINQD
jgi:hypothetical protein